MFRGEYDCMFVVIRQVSKSFRSSTHNKPLSSKMVLVQRDLDFNSLLFLNLLSSLPNCFSWQTFYVEEFAGQLSLTWEVFVVKLYFSRASVSNIWMLFTCWLSFAALISVFSFIHGRSFGNSSSANLKNFRPSILSGLIIRSPVNEYLFAQSSGFCVPGTNLHSPDSVSVWISPIRWLT